MKKTLLLSASMILLSSTVFALPKSDASDLSASTLWFSVSQTLPSDFSVTISLGGGVATASGVANSLSLSSCTPSVNGVVEFAYSMPSGDEQGNLACVSESNNKGIRFSVPNTYVTADNTLAAITLGFTAGAVTATGLSSEFNFASCGKGANVAFIPQEADAASSMTCDSNPTSSAKKGI